MKPTWQSQSIQSFIGTHFDLHGSLKASPSAIMSELNSFGLSFDPNDFYKMFQAEYKQRNSVLEFGLFVGRLQPFHMGHQNIINEIILAGKVPIILIGSINDDRDLDKNPLTFAQRKELIEIIYPNNEVIVLGIEDKKSWDDWFSNVYRTLQKVTTNPEKNVSLFFHNKECDRTDFTYKNRDYKESFYTELFIENNFSTTPIEFVDRKDFKIDANGRDIRHNIEGFKHFLDGRVYNHLKYLGWN